MASLRRIPLLLVLLMLSRRVCSFLSTRNGLIGIEIGKRAVIPLFGIPTNKELVEQRLAVHREKKAARQRSIEEYNARNYRLKRLLHSNASVAPEMYAVRVSVCEELRDELKLSGREKRGRVFIEKGSNATTCIKSLKYELHNFFRALKKSSYLLSAGYPEIEPDGKVTTPAGDSTNNFWDLQTNEDVLKTFQAADSFYDSSIGNVKLKRPAIAIHVRTNPNAPKPPPPPEYLKDLPDPAQSETMTMLSFYGFPPSGIENPEDFAANLRKLWKPFSALGRVYVAKEGVNAQMSVPTNVLEAFCECCRTIPEYGPYLENDINIDPIPLTMAEFAEAGTPNNGEPAPPFRNLHVRVRNQIVADGLDKELNWQSAGYDMPPMEWHQKLQEAQQQREKGEVSPIILDCRNNYESDVGIFEGAEPLETESFRESWDALRDRLADSPKDAPIMTYCTGGIRCVKVGAFLTQELGFKNVSRLAGGIIAYDRELNKIEQDETSDESSLFKGTNFVFDGRLGRTITDDALGTCITCGTETSMVSNCLNPNCHKRMVQCERCGGDFHGTCSDKCRNRVVNEMMLPKRAVSLAEPLEDTQTAFSTLDEYSSTYATQEPPYYRELEKNTQALIPTGSHMVSGSTQGRLLTQFASMTREGRILELGTFTGYATACLLEGAANVADVTSHGSGNREGGPFVMSMERDGSAYGLAVAQLRAICEGEETNVIASLEKIRSGGVTCIQVPETTDTSTVLQYGTNKVGCELLRVTDALAMIEEMGAGKGAFCCDPFDMVFVDADKTRLLEYTDACLGSDRLLKRGGLIVVDNVLWKGLVLDAANGFTSPLDEASVDKIEYRKKKRARKLASRMHAFNREIIKDDRAEVLILQIRDGLSIIRKR